MKFSIFMEFKYLKKPTIWYRIAGKFGGYKFDESFVISQSKLVVTISNPLADLFIRQTFSAKCLKRVNSPNILPIKLSHYTVCTCTVKPLNNGHFGTIQFWYNFTVIQRLSSLRDEIVLPWSCRDHRTCPL